MPKNPKSAIFFWKSTIFLPTFFPVFFQISSAEDHFFDLADTSAKVRFLRFFRASFRGRLEQLEKSADFQKNRFFWDLSAQLFFHFFCARALFFTMQAKILPCGFIRDMFATCPPTFRQVRQHVANFANMCANFADMSRHVTHLANHQPDNCWLWLAVGSLSTHHL